jgi:predicted amidohydrolase YtcJ
MESSRRAPDLIVTGAEVFTGEALPTWANAFAVTEGIFSAVGDAEDVLALQGPRTEVTDLRGRTVLPGFIDSHIHPVDGGAEMLHCGLLGRTTIGEYQQAVRKYSAAHPDAEWIQGGGWSMDAFERGVPDAALLDAIVPDRPAILYNRDHHTAWVNSAALRLAGITAATSDPADGRIERDGDGQPTGALHEGAMDLVARLVPPPGGEFRAQALRAAQHYLHSLGVTGWQDAAVRSDPDDAAAYAALRDRGELTSRVVGAQWFDRNRGSEQVAEILGRRAAFSSGLFRLSSVKIMLDGVCETFTAALSSSYLDGHGHETGNAGISFFEDAVLREYVTALDAEDVQVHVHAVGDRAVTQALDAVEAAIAAHGDRHNRHHIAHLQVVAPADLPRFRRLGVVVNGQPLWARLEPQMTELTLPFLGAERGRWQYPFGGFENAGAIIAFGSDWPVSTPDPWREIHVAVNRTPAPDKTRWTPADGAFLPEQRVSLTSAVRAFTLGSAYVNGAEAVSGSFAAGKSADFIVLDSNPFARPRQEIWRTRVEETWFAGECVYQR